MPQKDRDLVETIIKSISDFPDEVVVRAENDDRGVKIFVKVAPEDMGRVIGAKGVTVEGIRSVLKALGFKQQMAIQLKIEEPVSRA